MKTPTIQEQYNLIKEGKGHKGVFMKTVRSLFPEYINQYTSFDDTVSILKSKSVLSEGIGGLVTTGRKQDWHAIFNENMGSMNYDSWKKELIDIIKKDANLDDNEIEIDEEEIKRYYKEGKSPNEVYNNIWLKDAGNFRSLNESKEAKAEEKKPTKDVVDMETRGFDYKDPKNIDNVYGQEFLLGYYTEMKDPKNKDKSVDELKEIVAKNLAKDNQHYVKDGQFGVKGLGYTTEAPGLGKPKEVKGKYKASGMEPVKLKESKMNLNENFSEEDTENLKDILFKYIEDPNDAEKQVDVFYNTGEFSDPRLSNINDDEEFIEWLKGEEPPKEDSKYDGYITRDMGGNPDIYESKLRKVISQLIKEELNMKEIEEVGEDAKKKAMGKKIDEEIAKRKKKLKALTTLTELEEDSVNPKKVKELTNDIKKLEAAKKKLNKGKKKEEVEEITLVDKNTSTASASEIDKAEGTSSGTAAAAIEKAKATGKPVGVEGPKK